MRRLPFEVLVERHGVLVMRYLQAQLGRAEAEDAFQETMLSALRAYEDLRDPGAARAWLLRIAARVAIDAHRARGRGAVPMAEPPAAAAEPDPPDSSGVWERVGQLPDKQRSALALRFALDLPYREIGIVMGTREDAARRNVHEGLARLRTQIGDSLS